MPTLGNILARKGGTAMTGKEVTLTLAIPDPKGGAPIVEEATVVLLPVSERRKTKAFRAADQFIADCVANSEPAPSAQDERGLRFICESMRDSEDARKFFVDNDKLETFRDILIAEQLRLLLAAYDELIMSEYAEVRERAELQQMKTDATQIFPNGQG